MSFNLTQYISFLANYDPLMFLLLFVIMPLGIVAIIVAIVGLYKERQQHKRDYSFIDNKNSHDNNNHHNHKL